MDIAAAETAWGSKTRVLLITAPHAYCPVEPVVCDHSAYRLATALRIAAQAMHMSGVTLIAKNLREDCDNNRKRCRRWPFLQRVISLLPEASMAIDAHSFPSDYSWSLAQVPSLAVILRPFRGPFRRPVDDLITRRISEFVGKDARVYSDEAKESVIVADGTGSIVFASLAGGWQNAIMNLAVARGIKTVILLEVNDSAPDSMVAELARIVVASVNEST